MSRDDGSTRARYVFVGDAYGHWEQEYDRPLVGPSFNDKLKPWWSAVGLRRDDFYITNAWDQGYPKNITTIPEQEIRASFQRLHARLAALEGPDGAGPYVIIPVGNYSLYALTGLGVVHFHEKDGRHTRPDIRDWRGSVLQYTDLKGRKIKVIPTLYNNVYSGSKLVFNIFRNPEYEWVCERDWKRIAADGAFRELRLPERTHLIAPVKAEALEWLKWVRGEASKKTVYCSLDVETPTKVEYDTIQKESKSQATTAKCKSCHHARRWHEGVDVCRGLRGKGNCTCQKFAPLLSKPRKIKVSEEAYLGCIGYAIDPRMSMTIPTTLDYWQDPAVWDTVKAAIAAFHEDENIKFGGQNFTFDAWWCYREKIPLKNYAWDLLRMHRILVPYSKWHDLAFQGSLYTRQNFWKHEAKLPNELSRWSSNKEALWRYNGIDNCVQIELYNHHVEALKAAGRWEYYEEAEYPMDVPLLELSLRGMRTDIPGRKKHYDETIEKLGEVTKEINTAAEMVLVNKKAVSTTKMKTFLYEKLRLPVQYAKNKNTSGGEKTEKKATVNVVAIKRLMEQFPGNTQLQVVGRLVLRHRRLITESNYVKEERVSADGRQYAMFKQETALGRLKSFTTPMDEGANLQNVDRKLRKFYLPDIA